MTGLIKYLRTSAFRLAFLYFALFSTAAAIAVTYLYWKTNLLLAVQLEEGIQAEIHNLDRQFKTGGIERLRRDVAERSETPGNNLYLIANAQGEWIAGNLKSISPELWNSSGRVAFIYRRPDGGSVEERLAFASIFILSNGDRLIVGRDIEERRKFIAVIRSVFLWTLGAMALTGIGGGLFVSWRFLRRVENIASTSRTIMAGDLTRRIPLSSSDDEFDRLANSLNAMLQRIEELVTGFKEVSDNIAHDLKTPLNRLRNRIEAALRDSGENHREALREAIEDADDLIKTFDALLSIARLEAGTPPSARTRFDLNVVIGDVCELYEPVAEEKGTILQFQPAPPLIIEGERQLIAQAIANVLDNALKYGSERHSANAGEGLITLALTATAEYVEVGIADHGPGIPADQRERVLQRFVRLESSRSLPGSGLGLSLASAVTRLHGGQVKLSDNEPGLKVTLTFKRPVPSNESGSDR